MLLKQHVLKYSSLENGDEKNSIIKTLHLMMQMKNMY